MYEHINMCDLCTSERFMHICTVKYTYICTIYVHMNTKINAPTSICTAMVHYFVTYALFFQELFLQQVLNFVTLSEKIMFIYGFMLSLEFFVLKREFFASYEHIFFIFVYISSFPGSFQKNLKNLGKIKTTFICTT